MIIAVVSFLALLSLWILLPFLPSLREVRRRTDASPLPVSHESQVNIRYLAGRFRTHVLTPLTPVLDRCRAGRHNERGVLEDGTEFLVVGEGGDLNASRNSLSLHACDTMLLSSGDLRLPPGSFCRQDVYSAGRFAGGDECVFRAVLADGDVTFGERCTTLRWIHSSGNITAGGGCRLLGRVSADRELRLASSCRFERLHAPRIVFGTEVEGPAGTSTPRAITPDDLDKVHEDRAGRWLCRGRLRIGPGREIRADLVVTGRLEIGWGSRIVGSVKCHQDVTLETSVRITGSLVSLKSITAGRGCRIGGPVIAERSMELGPACVIGSPELPTTVYADSIYISPGVVCHGTVRAGRAGLLSGVEQHVLTEKPFFIHAPGEKSEPPVEAAVSHADEPGDALPGPAVASQRRVLPAPQPAGSAAGPVILRPGSTARAGEPSAASSVSGQPAGAIARTRLPGPVSPGHASQGIVVVYGSGLAARVDRHVGTAPRPPIAHSRGCRQGHYGHLPTGLPGGDAGCPSDGDVAERRSNGRGAGRASTADSSLVIASPQTQPGGR